MTMTQRELTAPAPVVLPEPEKALSIRPPADVQALTLPRTGLSLADVLAEFAERHHEFRKLFKEQLIEGEHYGTPPGVKRAEPSSQWVPRPSLYQAGADKAMLLMNVRPEYEPDMNAWTQAGAKPGTYCIRCRLVSRDTGKVVGEGLGADKVGNKQRDENSALKMAQKRAKVCAVLNSFGLSEMFSQDLEDMDHKAPAVDTPKNPNAPKPPKPRTDRVTSDELTGLLAEFKADRERKRMPSDKAALETFVREVCGMEGNPLAPGSWMRGDFEKVREALMGVPY